MSMHFPEKAHPNDPVGVRLPYYREENQLLSDTSTRKVEHSVNRFLVYLYCVAFILALLVVMVQSWV